MQTPVVEKLHVHRACVAAPNSLFMRNFRNFVGSRSPLARVLRTAVIERPTGTCNQNWAPTYDICHHKGTEPCLLTAAAAGSPKLSPNAPRVLAEKLQGQTQV